MKKRGSNGQFKATLSNIHCATCNTLFRPVGVTTKFCKHKCYTDSLKKVARKTNYAKTLLNGYVYIRDTERGRAVQEHRKIMELHIGRELNRNEVVHHKNRNKSDNRIENLELLKNNSDHRKHHATKEPCAYCGAQLNVDSKHNGHGLCKKCYLRAFRIAKKKGIAISIAAARLIGV